MSENLLQAVQVQDHILIQPVPGMEVVLPPTPVVAETNNGEGVAPLDVEQIVVRIENEGFDIIELNPENGGQEPPPVEVIPMVEVEQMGEHQSSVRGTSLRGKLRGKFSG